jgi:hypothetical protein
MKNIINEWDRWIYRRAHNSLRRMAFSDPALIYLLSLAAKDWSNKAGISNNLCHSAEVFYNAMSNADELRKEGSKKSNAERLALESSFRKRISDLQSS